MTDPDDAEIWRRIRDGDAEAFGMLFRRHGARIHGYALRRTADEAMADDVTAVVFLEVWRRRREVDLHQPSALPWLFGVAANVLNRWRRTRRRYQAALDRFASLPEPSPALVERQAEAAAEADRVMAEIGRLPRGERDVLVLSVWEGLSHAEVAAALDLPVGTVKSRLSRARTRLGRARHVVRPTGPLPAVLLPSAPRVRADLSTKETP